MRVFAALPLPAAAREWIEEAWRDVRTSAPGVRWVSKEALHLTLHFFGEVPEDRLSSFAPVFDDPDLRIPEIPARLGQPGFFPSTQRPRVLWMGLKAGVEAMSAFWNLFTKKLEPLRTADSALSRWSPEGRGFAPHVTVARAASAPLDPQWARGVSVPAGEFAITECVLFQSLLEPGGARYVPLKTIPFRGGAA